MSIRTPRDRPDYEVMALNGLAFLADEESRFERFINLTGLTLAEIRHKADDRAFLAGVLNYLRSDQSLLLVYAEQANLDPADIDRGAQSLAGGAP